MSAKTVEPHFIRLEELIFDDDKIITLWGLAGLLTVPLKEARDVLKKFIQTIKEKHPDRNLAVTYSLIGTLKKNNSKGVSIVKEDELAAKRLEYSDINDECVYSVQKNVNVDLNVMALANEEVMSQLEVPLKQLVLASKSCSRRNIKKRPPPAVEQKAPIIKTEPKKEDSTEKSAPAKQNGIKNMFSNMPAKAKIENSKKEVKKSKPNGLSAFLSSQPVKKEPKSDLPEKTETEATPVKENDKNQCNNAEKMDVDEEIKEKTAKRPRKEKNSSQSAKKRKRIVIKDDSDSDDIFGDDNEENNVVKEFDDEDEAVVAEKPVKIQEPEPVPKNKRRKAVDKIYEDEDGFIVTQKEYVEETASETEDEPIPEKLDSKKDKKEVVTKKGSSSSVEDPSPKRATGGGKKGNKKAVPSNQQSITNFFKRK